METETTATSTATLSEVEYETDLNSNGDMTETNVTEAEVVQFDINGDGDTEDIISEGSNFVANPPATDNYETKGRSTVLSGEADALSLSVNVQDEHARNLTGTVIFTATSDPPSLFSQSFRQKLETEDDDDTANKNEVGTGTYEVSSLPTDIHFRITVKAVYEDGSADGFEIGSWDIIRSGDLATVTAETCVTDTKNKVADDGCGKNSKPEDVFDPDREFMVKVVTEDDRGSATANTSVTVKVAEDDEDVFNEDSYDATSGSATIIVDDEAESGVYTLTIEAVQDEDTDDEITKTTTVMVTVTGELAKYQIDGAERIMAGTSEIFTVTARDALGNRGRFAEDQDTKVAITVEGPGGDSVRLTGLDAGELDLMDGGKATFRIRAVTGAPSSRITIVASPSGAGLEDISEATRMVYIGPEIMAPGMPMNVMAEATSHDMITVSWASPAEDGGSDITGYMVQRGYMDADNMMMWMDVDPAHMGMDMMYMDMGLMAETTYYYRVAAMNSAGMGEYSDGMAMDMTMADTDTSLQAIPNSSISVTNNADSSITVNWMGGDNADRFIVVAAELGSDPFTYELENVADGAARMATISGLNSSSSYIIIVIALQGSNFEYGVSQIVMAN